MGTIKKSPSHDIDQLKKYNPNKLERIRKASDRLLQKFLSRIGDRILVIIIDKDGDCNKDILQFKRSNENVLFRKINKKYPRYDVKEWSYANLSMGDPPYQTRLYIRIKYPIVDIIDLDAVPKSEDIKFYYFNDDAALDLFLELGDY